jgi:ABC-type transport system substrate-binding protein
VSDVYGLYGRPNVPPHGENATRYCSPRVDALVAQFEHSYDIPTRRRLFAQVGRRLIADVSTIMLYVWEGGYATSKHITGFRPPLLTPFDDMMNVEVR